MKFRPVETFSFATSARTKFTGDLEWRMFVEQEVVAGCRPGDAFRLPLLCAMMLMENC